MSRTRKLFLFIGVPLLIVFGGVIVMAARSNKTVTSTPTNSSNQTATTPEPTKPTASKLDPWNEKCRVSDHGRKDLTVSPMPLSEIETIMPMGLTAGGHVTPIDHMYFYPVSTPGDRFSAKIYAAADGIITGVQHRGSLVDGPPDAKPSTDEFRLTIEQTCNQGYYYDLITRLAPDIKKKVGTLKGYEGTAIDMPIKAGDLIGYVGNQSLDFGVYDTEVTLGFIVPEHYQGEPWKIHTADAFSYFTKEAFKVFEPKVIRYAEPRSGKIDYDKDGYLIGNWFEKGTNGYAGKTGQMGEGYWSGHLALLYDAIDPKMITISMGNFKKSDGSDAQAFSVIGNQPDPGTITKASGLVKYELTNSINYYLPDGTPWDHKTPSPGITAKVGTQVAGTILFQLTDTRVLKAEVFPGQAASEVTGFSDKAKIYER